MVDWIGSLRMRECSPMRVELSLSRSTRFAGFILLGLGALLALRLWSVSLLLMVVPGLLGFVGVLLLTIQRELIFDREAGVLQVDQRALGLGSRAVVPLFHLRAVVIVAQPSRSAKNGWRLFLASPSRYVAYVDRRVGGAIYLDESRRCATLLTIAEAIAEVAEVRLEYDAMSHIDHSPM